MSVSWGGGVVSRALTTSSGGTANRTTSGLARSGTLCMFAVVPAEKAAVVLL